MNPVRIKKHARVLTEWNSLIASSVEKWDQSNANLVANCTQWLNAFQTLGGCLSGNNQSIFQKDDVVVMEQQQARLADMRNYIRLAYRQRDEQQSVLKSLQGEYQVLLSTRDTLLEEQQLSENTNNMNNIYLTSFMQVLKWHESVLDMFEKEQSVKYLIIDSIFSPNHEEFLLRLQHNIHSSTPNQHISYALESLTSPVHTLVDTYQSHANPDQMIVYLTAMQQEAYINKSLIHVMKTQCQHTINTQFNLLT